MATPKMRMIGSDDRYLGGRIREIDNKSSWSDGMQEKSRFILRVALVSQSVSGWDNKVNLTYRDATHLKLKRKHERFTIKLLK